MAKVGEDVAAEQASAAAAATAAAEAAAERGEEPAEAAGVSELLKPHKETEAVLVQIWNPAVSKEYGSGGFTLLNFMSCTKNNQTFHL